VQLSRTGSDLALKHPLFAEKKDDDLSIVVLEIALGLSLRATFSVVVR